MTCWPLVVTFCLCQVTAAQQQQKLKSSETENELLERDLTKAIDDVKQKTRKLRDKMTGGQLRVRTGLRDLTVQSDSAAKRLQAAINKVLIYLLNWLLILNVWLIVFHNIFLHFNISVFDADVFHCCLHSHCFSTFFFCFRVRGFYVSENYVTN